MAAHKSIDAAYAQQTRMALARGFDSCRPGGEQRRVEGGYLKTATLEREYGARVVHPSALIPQAGMDGSTVPLAYNAVRNWLHSVQTCVRCRCRVYPWSTLGAPRCVDRPSQEVFGNDASRREHTFASEGDRVRHPPILNTTPSIDEPHSFLTVLRVVPLCVVEAAREAARQMGDLETLRYLDSPLREYRTARDLADAPFCAIPATLPVLHNRPVGGFSSRSRVGEEGEEGEWAYVDIARLYLQHMLPTLRLEEFGVKDVMPEELADVLGEATGLGRVSSMHDRVRYRGTLRKESAAPQSMDALAQIRARVAQLLTEGRLPDTPAFQLSGGKDPTNVDGVVSVTTGTHGAAEESVNVLLSDECDGRSTLTARMRALSEFGRPLAHFQTYGGSTAPMDVDDTDAGEADSAANAILFVPFVVFARTSDLRAGADMLRWIKPRIPTPAQLRKERYRAASAGVMERVARFRAGLPVET
jgi:hypothetical protein